jgi:hypothetical protein
MRSILSLLLAAALLCGCSSRREATRPEASAMTLAPSAIPRDTALAMMKRLESAPLAASAVEERRLAFEWLAANAELGQLGIEGQYLKPLVEGDYPFAGELLMQFAFGMAMHRFTPEGETGEPEAEIEAGLLSVITAYRNMKQLDIKLGDRFLDDLDQIRRLGRLRAYIAKVDEQNR